MKVSTMRLVDRWLGLPACAVLTGVRRLAGLLGRAGGDPPRRIVFVKLAEQGSTVLAVSAFRRAIDLVGRENVHFLCFEENRFILDIMELIPEGNVIPIRRSVAPRPSDSTAARPARASSSAPSCAQNTASRPPAIKPTTCAGSVPNVGGHSAASATPSRPLVPAPT